MVTSFCSERASGCAGYRRISRLFRGFYNTRRLHSTLSWYEFVPVPEIESGWLPLAFDHVRIVSNALDHVRSCLETPTLARWLGPPECTINQLGKPNESRVWETQFNAANFQRREAVGCHRQGPANDYG